MKRIEAAQTSRGPRHAWVRGDVAGCLDLVRRLDGARMLTIWAEGTWRPERLLQILELHFTLSAVIEARDLETLRATEALIAQAPALYHETATRLVIVTPHLPSLTAAELAAAGLAVFTIGQVESRLGQAVAYAALGGNAAEAFGAAEGVA